MTKQFPPTCQIKLLLFYMSISCLIISPILNVKMWTDKPEMLTSYTASPLKYTPHSNLHSWVHSEKKLKVKMTANKAKTKMDF